MSGGLVISLGGELHGMMIMTQTQTDDDNDKMQTDMMSYVGLVD